MELLEREDALAALVECGRERGRVVLVAGEAVRYDRCGAFLDVLAAGRTVVVEDVHWADEATLYLLIFAGRRIRDLIILVHSFRIRRRMSGGTPCGSARRI